MMKRTAILGVLVAILQATGASAVKSEQLGTIVFPNSGSPEAQAAFLKGIALAHSFWYEEAAEAFQEAQKADPDFALAYWGEAMTYNHPLWSEQDIAAARKVLGRLGETRQVRLAKAPSAREKAYLAAVEVLYGEGDKLERDRAYSKAMEEMVRQFPDDKEATCLYALSLLGTVRPGESGFRRQMKSASLLQPVFEAHPNHPGAAHYLIHSFDDPEHAPLGLEAANRYAEIAPAAHHALHMPSHIYVQLGMWDQVASSNKAAYEASEAWVERRKISPTKKDYHSLEWRQYALIQLGRYREAREALEPVRQVAEATGDSRVRNDYVRMNARYVLETGNWQKLPLPADDGEAYDRRRSSGGLLLAAGLSAVKLGDLALAEEARRKLLAMIQEAEKAGKAYDAKPLMVMEKEVAGVIHLARGDAEGGLTLLEKAAEVEESLDPPSGPANPLKPAHELYGEGLLEQKRHQQAADQFEKALLRMPRRTASLLGRARAAAKLNDRATAERYYRELAAIWRGADDGLPQVAEARAFIASPATEGRN